MDIAACLEKLVPNPGICGSATFRDRIDYESRKWVDGRKKPSWSDLETVWPQVETANAAMSAIRDTETRIAKRRLQADLDAAINAMDAEAEAYLREKIRDG